MCIGVREGIFWFDSPEVSHPKIPVPFDRALALIIRDNRQGFVVENAPKGLGLESMRERVDLSGGEFQIDSVIGQGPQSRQFGPLHNCSGA